MSPLAAKDAATHMTARTLTRSIAKANKTTSGRLDRVVTGIQLGSQSPNFREKSLRNGFDFEILDIVKSVPHAPLNLEVRGPTPSDRQRSNEASETCQRFAS